MTSFAGTQMPQIVRLGGSSDVVTGIIQTTGRFSPPRQIHSRYHTPDLLLLPKRDAASKRRYRKSSKR